MLAPFNLVMSDTLSATLRDHRPGGGNTSEDGPLGPDLSTDQEPGLEGSALDFSAGMQDAADKASQFLRAIGSEHRLLILCALMGGSKTVTEICNAVSARQSLVSQHLMRLRLDGLVTVERDGHFAHYSIGDPLVREIVTALHKRFCPTPTGGGDH